MASFETTISDLLESAGTTSSATGGEEEGVVTASFFKSFFGPERRLVLFTIFEGVLKDRTDWRVPEDVPALRGGILMEYFVFCVFCVLCFVVFVFIVLSSSVDRVNRDKISDTKNEGIIYSLRLAQYMYAALNG